MTAVHSRLLSWTSSLVGAPIVAFPVFVALSILEAAKQIFVVESMVFATLLPLAGIFYFAKIEGLEYDVPERKDRTRPFVVAIVSYVTGFSLLVIGSAPVLVSGPYASLCG